MRFSIIIAARALEDCAASLRAVRGLDYPPDDYEVLVAIGRQPSRQRNRAARAARGDYLLFLDDDSRPVPALLRIYAQALAGSGAHAAADIVGGPTIYAAGLAPEPAGFARVAEAVFASSFGSGPLRARYAARGRLRETDERELILCNLVVRRALYLAERGLADRLYPGEENEFLKRVRARARALYDPRAVCHRPPCGSVGDFLRQMFRYGRGRAKHLRKHATSTDALCLAPGLLVLYLAALTACSAARACPLAWAPVALYATVALVAAAARSRRYPWLALALPPLFLGGHLAYGAGLGAGLALEACARLRPPRGTRPGVAGPETARAVRLARIKPFGARPALEAL